MRIWLITIGEPLPIDGKGDRLYRTGILAGILEKQGHEVVWWTSTVDHVRKKQRFDTDKFVTLSSNLRFVCLHSIFYRKNISLSRIINHVGIARKFRALSKREEKPDIILCSFPTIELSAEAVKYGRSHGVPVVLDVRDLWPDIFVNLIPSWIRFVPRLLLWRWFQQTRFAFRHCTAIIGVSQGYLDWGLKYAGRAKTDYDCIFPLGYKNSRAVSIDQDRIAEEMADIGVDTSRVTFLFIGSFGRTYDLSVVIEAARRLEHEHCDRIQFVLCGDGERYTEWKEQARGLSSIIFTGWINREQVSYLLSISNVGLAAYAKGAPQGLPNKFFEYMSAGLAILSSLNGEGEQLIEKAQCGYTYSAGDVENLVNGVRILLDDDYRKKMAKSSLATFEENYRAEKVYGEMSRYLERIAVSKES